jgi:hypothetical protein
MSGDQQQRVKKAPPVRLGKVPAHGVRERRKCGHELDGELVGIQVCRFGDNLDRPPEPGGAAEPDQGGGRLGRSGRPRFLVLLGRDQRDD